MCWCAVAGRCCESKRQHVVPGPVLGGRQLRDVVRRRGPDQYHLPEQPRAQPAPGGRAALRGVPHLRQHDVRGAAAGLPAVRLLRELWWPSERLRGQRGGRLLPGRGRRHLRHRPRRRPSSAGAWNASSSTRVQGPSGVWGSLNLEDPLRYYMYASPLEALCLRWKQCRFCGNGLRHR